MKTGILRGLLAFNAAVFAQDAPANRPPRPTGGPSSPDGLTWTRDAGVRLEHASVPCAVAAEGRVFLYFVDAERGPGTRGESVGCAISDDGSTFTKQAFAIEGMPSDKAVDPSAVRTADGKFRLCYFASSSGAISRSRRVRATRCKSFTMPSAITVRCRSACCARYC